MKKIIALILIMITPLTELASTFKTSVFEYELTKIENKKIRRSGFLFSPQDNRCGTGERNALQGP